MPTRRDLGPACRDEFDLAPEFPQFLDLTPKEDVGLAGEFGHEIAKPDGAGRRVPARRERLEGGTRGARLRPTRFHCFLITHRPVPDDDKLALAVERFNLDAYHVQMILDLKISFDSLAKRQARAWDNNRWTLAEYLEYRYMQEFGKARPEKDTPRGTVPIPNFGNRQFCVK